MLAKSSFRTRNWWCCSFFDQKFICIAWTIIAVQMGPPLKRCSKKVETHHGGFPPPKWGNPPLIRLEWWVSLFLRWKPTSFQAKAYSTKQYFPINDTKNWNCSLFQHYIFPWLKNQKSDEEKFKDTIQNSLEVISTTMVTLEATLASQKLILEQLVQKSNSMDINSSFRQEGQDIRSEIISLKGLLLSS